MSQSKIDELERILNSEDDTPVRIMSDGTVRAWEDTMSEQTFGEKAVGISFNPSGDDKVHMLKKVAADFIDLCNEARDMAANGEVSRMYSVAITEAQTAQMWAVKAATWKDH